jgi:hypothetical protein
VRRKIGQPRFIDPSLVEEGDEISVEHKEDRGITTILKGVVAKRIDTGTVRRFTTSENATLFAYEPGKPVKIRITLYAREEPEHAGLFDLEEAMTNIRKRIA